MRVIFSGGDKANRDYLDGAAQKASVADKIQLTGFVKPEKMKELFKGAVGILSSSYFGPTNLPPIEAWSMERPLRRRKRSRSAFD